MSCAQTVLEYLRVVLSMPIAVLTVSLVFILLFKKEIRGLIDRIASLKFGGFEATASQSRMSNQVMDNPAVPAASPDPQIETAQGTNAVLSASPNAAQEVLDAERARASFWEFRFLDFFLVPNTQRVLDWLLSLNERATVPLYDAIWSQSIHDSNERMAILDALRNHYLIQFVDGLIEVTPKGREYAALRNPSRRG